MDTKWWVDARILILVVGMGGMILGTPLAGWIWGFGTDEFWNRVFAPCVIISLLLIPVYIWLVEKYGGIK